jgi:WD40 repeat protein
METLSATLGVNTVATCSEDSSVRVWTINPENIAEITQVYEFPDVRNDLANLSFSFDFKYLACTSESKVFVFDLAASKLLWELDTGSRVNKVIRFSRIDYRLLTSRIHDILIWDGETGQMWKRIMQPATASVHFYGEDESKLIGLIGNRIIIFDISGPKEVVVATIDAHNDSIDNFAFDAKGMRVVTGSRREPLKVWEVPSAEFKELSAQSDIIGGIAMNADCSKLAGVYNGAIKVWDVATDMLVADVPIRPRVPVSITFNRNGDVLVACTDGNVVVIRSTDGEILTTWKCHRNRVCGICHVEPIAILM